MSVWLTGGSGLLGGELRQLLPELKVPTRAECDITSREQVLATARRLEPELIVHAAAFTDVAGAESRRAACWATNVAGTRNMVEAARESGAYLLHISTDYVFYGDTSSRESGGYREDDPPGPVRNYYALSKLAAEEVARTAPRHLIVRTSFRPRQWPYPVAYSDLYTSQDYVDVIAPELAELIRRLPDIPYDTLHLATERKSALELARRRSPQVREASKASAGVALPDDITLDSSRWRGLKAQWGGQGSVGSGGR